MNELRRSGLRLVSLYLAIALVACAPARESRPDEAPATSTVAPPSPGPASGETTAPGTEVPVLVGTVVGVADGDTIKVQLDSGPITVRLDSIDAPEKSQAWGREAYAALYRRLNQQIVALEVRKQDRYERLVAVVYLHSENVNAWLVREGHAWAYRWYLSDPAFCSWEDSARSMRRGLWSLPATDWIAPWEWRRAQRRDAGAYTDYARETAQHCVQSMRPAQP